jgi:hypothetical protein
MCKHFFESVNRNLWSWNPCGNPAFQTGKLNPAFTPKLVVRHSKNNTGGSLNGTAGATTDIYFYPAVE